MRETGSVGGTQRIRALEVIRSGARHRRRRSLGDHLFAVYLVALFGLPAVYLMVLAAQTVPPLPALQATLLTQRLSVALPAGLLVAVLAGLRLAAWRGSVVVSQPDVTWLLSAPVPRADVLRRPLIRSLLLGALAVAVCGLVGTVPLAVAVGAFAAGVGMWLALLAAGALTAAALGLLVVAVGWFVECARGWRAWCCGSARRSSRSS